MRAETALKARPAVIAAALLALIVALFVVRAAGSDQPPFAVMVWVIALIVAGGSPFLVSSARARRAAALADVAAKNGWDYRVDVTTSPMDFAIGLIPFQLQEGVMAVNLLSGEVEGVPFHLVDGEMDSIRTRNAKNRAAAVLLLMPFSASLTIQPEHLRHRLADAVGEGDIDNESHEFSRRFWVTSPDRRLAYDILHPEMSQFLLLGDRRWIWHWNGPWLSVSHKGNLRPDECKRLVDAAATFRRLVPRHVIASQPTLSGWAPAPDLGWVQVA